MDEGTSSAPKERKGLTPTKIGTGIGAAVLVVITGLTYLGGLWSPAAQARPDETSVMRGHAHKSSAELSDRSLDEKVDHLIDVVGDLQVTADATSATVKAQAADISAATRAVQSQATDIAVIKRQLGLDGLGPPPQIPFRGSRIVP